jgi:plastocyanin
MPHRSVPSLLKVFALLALIPALPARGATSEVAVGGAGLVFTPATVNIHLGDTVTWHNAGGFHNVKADNGSFSSGSVSGAAWTFSHTYNSAGTFGYHCEEHGLPGTGMFGTVIVTSTPAGPPNAPTSLTAAPQTPAEIALSWTDNANNETGFSIERKSLGGSYQVVGTVASNVTTFLAGGLEAAKLYTFRVRATGSGNTFSAYTNEAGAATNAPPGPCVAGPTTLCLNNGRFRAEIDWRNANGPGEGQAVPLPSAPDSGLFYFFSPTNIEMLLKVLNACVPPFNRFWVFYAATTNVEFTLTVTDTQTGRVNVYVNPLNQVASPVQDVNAFATCP